MGIILEVKRQKEPGLKPWFYACNLLIIKSIFFLVKDIIQY